MPIIEAVVEAVAGKVISALAGRLGAGGATGLPPELAKSLQAASSSTRPGKLKSWFSNGGRGGALGAALRAAVEQTEADHPEFVRAAGEIDWGFLEFDAPEELAKALVPGAHPDAGRLAEMWATSTIKDPSPELARWKTEVARAPMATLVRRWEAELRARPALGALLDRSTQQDVADATERVAEALGRGRAQTGDRAHYLEQVEAEHRWLDTTGAGTVAATGRIELTDVFSGLSASPSARPDPTAQSEIDRLRHEMADEAGAWTPAKEAMVDALIERSRFGRGTGEEPARERLPALPAKHPQLALLGDAGSGKTTLLRWLANRHANALLSGREKVALPGGDDGAMAVRFPVYVRAGSLVKHDGWRTMDLIEFLVADHKIRSYPSPDRLADLFRSALERGDCLVLLDALDEIPSADDRHEVVKRFESFARAWAPRDNRFLVTSRPAGYWSAPLGGGFSHYTVRDMDPETEVPEFLQKYLRAQERSLRPGDPRHVVEEAAATRAETILEQVQRNRGVRRLTRNPLLLTILVIVQGAYGPLPDQRARLYDDAVKALERGWRLGQAVPSGALPDQRLTRRFLVQLATWTHATQPSGINTIDDIMEAVGEWWADEHQRMPLGDGSWPAVMKTEIEGFVQRVAQHTGLLAERAPERWGFVHQTFQEFYVAHRLIDDDEPARAIRTHLHDPRYDEPILLALGIASHVNQSRRAADLFDAALLAQGPLAAGDSDFFQPADFEDLLGTDLRFAQRAAADDVLVNLDTLESLSAKPLSVGRQTLRDASGSAFGSRLAEVLRSLAQNPNTDDWGRQGAAAALGQLGDTSTDTVELLRSLAQSPNSDKSLRRAAAAALGQLGDTSTDTVELLRSLARDPHTYASVRVEAAAALGQLGDTSTAVEVLRSLAQSPNTDEALRRGAAAALGQLGDTSTAVEVLRSLAQIPNTDEALRRGAAAALVQLGDTSTGVEVLRSLAQNPNSWTPARVEAASALAELGDTSTATLELLHYLAQNRRASVGWEATWALGQLGDTSTATLELLHRLAEDPNTRTSVRIGAAGALRELGVLRPPWTH